jgi:ribonuclease E
VFEVSNLGLVEMTRKNESEGLLESFSHVCPTCAGRGVVLFEDAATTGVQMPAAEGEG